MQRQFTRRHRFRMRSPVQLFRGQPFQKLASGPYFLFEFREERLGDGHRLIAKLQLVAKSLRSIPFQTLFRFALGSILDAVELIFPEPLKRFDPVMHWLQLSRIECVQAAFALFFDRHQPHRPQDSEMFRDSRLSQFERIDQFGH